MRDQAGTVIVNRAPAMIEGPEIVRYDWTPADTAVAGRMLAEIEITWPDGRRETAPNAGWIEVLISQDIARAPALPGSAAAARPERRS